MIKEVYITTEFITLGQFLKYEGIIDSGFLAKLYLADHKVFINGEEDNRRGRKLYSGYHVIIEKQEYIIKSQNV